MCRVALARLLLFISLTLVSIQLRRLLKNLGYASAGPYSSAQIRTGVLICSAGYLHAAINHFTIFKLIHRRENIWGILKLEELTPIQPPPPLRSGWGPGDVVIIHQIGLTGNDVSEYCPLNIPEHLFWVTFDRFKLLQIERASRHTFDQPSSPQLCMSVATSSLPWKCARMTVTPSAADRFERWSLFVYFNVSYLRFS